MQKVAIIIVVIAVLFIGGVIALIATRNSTAFSSRATPAGLSGTAAVSTPMDSSDSSAPSASAGEVQKITLGMKNYNYYPNTITVKSGIPVEITLDSSVSGCYRSFVVQQFGVSTYSQNPAQTIRFTPDKKGTFQFQCSMGMGYGTLVVE